MKKKVKAAIAVEGILTQYSTKGGSSRLTADSIVDTVLRIMDGKKINTPKPWEAFSIAHKHDTKN